MKIAVVGSGAMGCLFGALIRRSGGDVRLLDNRRDRSDRIRREGVRLEGISGSMRVPVPSTTDPREIGRADLVMICVKAFDTEGALRAAAPMIGPETLLLSFQNGLGNVEKLLEAADPNRVVGGVTSQGATEIEPGVIHHAGRGDSFIAGIPGERPTGLARIKELLDGAGIHTGLAEDLEGLLWGKLLINAGINALTAVFRLPNGGLLASDEIRAIMGDVVQEAAAVAEARGIRLPYADPRAKVEEVARKTATNLSSMLQDVRKKRKTEIGAINGAIVREAAALDLPVPVNALLVRIVKAIEACYDLGSVGTPAVG